MQDKYWEIRDRNFGVLSKKEQETLKEKSVVVIGLGCVGELEAVMLARIGVGNIIICDFDELKIINLNRNPYSFLKDLGKPKVENIKNIINNIDPSINIIPVSKQITFGDEKLIENGDVIIQAIDNIVDRIKIHRMIEKTIKKDIITMSGGPPNRSFVAVFPNNSEIAYEEFLCMPTVKLSDKELLSSENSEIFIKMKRDRAKYSKNWGAINDWVNKYETGERSIWAVTPIRPYLTSVISVNEAIKILLNKNTVITVPNYYSINLERISNPVSIKSGPFNYYEY